MYGGLLNAEMQRANNAFRLNGIRIGLADAKQKAQAYELQAAGQRQQQGFNEENQGYVREDRAKKAKAEGFADAFGEVDTFGTLTPKGVEAFGKIGNIPPPASAARQADGSQVWTWPDGTTRTFSAEQIGEFTAKAGKATKKTGPDAATANVWLNTAKHYDEVVFDSAAKAQAIQQQIAGMKAKLLEYGRFGQKAEKAQINEQLPILEKQLQGLQNSMEEAKTMRDDLLGRIQGFGMKQQSQGQGAGLMAAQGAPVAPVASAVPAQAQATPQPGTAGLSQGPPVLQTGMNLTDAIKAEQQAKAQPAAAAQAQAPVATGPVTQDIPPVDAAGAKAVFDQALKEGNDEIKQEDKVSQRGVSRSRAFSSADERPSPADIKDKFDKAVSRGSKAAYEAITEAYRTYLGSMQSSIRDQAGLELWNMLFPNSKMSQSELEERRTKDGIDAASTFPKGGDIAWWVKEAKKQIGDKVRALPRQADPGKAMLIRGGTGLRSIGQDATTPPWY